LLIDFAAKVLVKMQSAAFSDGVARREKTKFTKKKIQNEDKTLHTASSAGWEFGMQNLFAFRPGQDRCSSSSLWRFGRN